MKRNSNVNCATFVNQAICFAIVMVQMCQRTLPLFTMQWMWWYLYLWLYAITYLFLSFNNSDPFCNAINVTNVSKDIAFVHNATPIYFAMQVMLQIQMFAFLNLSNQNSNQNIEDVNG